ncbi:MAG: DUF1016 domain-containing protein [bacterium]|nr:DUF1016 domain-containing protein [bacterium]
MAKLLSSNSDSFLTCISPGAPGGNVYRFPCAAEGLRDRQTEFVDRMSRDLKNRYGKGFSRSNVIYMRLLYIKYPKSETLSHQLSL